MWKLGEFHGGSAQFQTHFQASETLRGTYGPLTRPGRIGKCSHAYRYVQWDVDYPRIRSYTCAHVWKLGGFHGGSAQFQTHFQASETLRGTYGPLTRPARMGKCSHAYRYVQWDVD